MAYTIVIILIFLLVSSFIVLTTSLYNFKQAKRYPRTLTFPETAPTRVQFIGGIGIPVEDLNFESITSGYVLKAEYFLPTKAEEFRPNHIKPQTIHRRRSVNETLSIADDASRQHLHTQRSADDSSSPIYGDNFINQQIDSASAYRWIIYRSIEMALDRVGLAGRACMLRTICEHAAIPLHYESGLLAEILNIILTPSTSHDTYYKSSDKDYEKAERLGRKGTDCGNKYRECSDSPIDRISAVFDLHI